MRTHESFSPISLTAVSWVLIGIAILSGILLYLVLASADDWWHLVQLLFIHEATLVLAIMLRVGPVPATANNDEGTKVGVEPTFECPKDRDGRPLLH